jgi:cadmium resistance protein CadD (predicted permease)
MMNMEKQKENNMNESAREAASRFIGKFGMPMIVLLVIVGVFAAMFLSAEALTPVIGLVSTAAMALIGILTGITGTKDKEERPEIEVIKELVARLDKEDIPMSVTVEGDKVTVTKGSDSITTKGK